MGVGVSLACSVLLMDDPLLSAYRRVLSLLPGWVVALFLFVCVCVVVVDPLVGVCELSPWSSPHFYARLMCSCRLSVCTSSSSSNSSVCTIGGRYHNGAHRHIHGQHITRMTTHTHTETISSATVCTKTGDARISNPTTTTHTHTTGVAATETT